MCESKLVSAIVITHNRKSLVTRAIQSVLKQTYNLVECIVVDDASEDGTKEMLEKLSLTEKFRYIYIPKEESRGGNHARNVGILAAKGDYICFLDDDDEWLPNKTQLQIEYLTKSPEISMVHCGKIFEYNFDRQEKQDLNDLPEGNFQKQVWVRVPFTTSCIMVRKSLFEQVGLFDEKLRFWQEYELGIRICQETEIAAIHEHLVLYRVILTDKRRLTNNLKGWEQAVQYIEDKHARLLTNLPGEIKIQHKKHVYYDGILRANNSGDLKARRKYLKLLFQIEKTPITFIKYILNTESLRKK